jgi:prepilin-type N-terminal cleavage/methylation domain-containing protein
MMQLLLLFQFILEPLEIPTILGTTTWNKLIWSLIMEDARHSGFTLIELLVTLAVAAVLAGLSRATMPLRTNSLYIFRYRSALANGVTAGAIAKTVIAMLPLPQRPYAAHRAATRA